jgi:hypothetical protein
MIKIAHRGNRFGPNKELENSESYLLESINAGFDVEIDVWLIDDNFYLGHNGPEHKTLISFLQSISKNSWIHCKNFDALHYFASNNFNFRYFWHQEDYFTLASNNIIWTYPGKEYGSESVLVDLESDSLDRYIKPLYGVCSDYVGLMV